MGTSSSKKALKSGTWYTLCNFIVKGAAFLTTPIFTRLLSSNDIGEFSNLTTWIGILMIVATFELSSSVGVAYYDFRDEFDDYIASNLLLGSTITLVFYVVCFTFKGFFLRFLGFSEFQLHITFLYLMVCPAIQMFQGQKQIKYEYKTSVTLSLTSLLSSTLISLLCVICAENKLFARTVGYYGSLILINIGIYIYILRKAAKIRVCYWQYAVKISAPMIIHLLAGNLLSTSDRVMIRNMEGAETAAIYTVAYSCAMIVQVLWMSMNSAWSPWAYEMMNKGNYDAMRKASRPYVASFGFIAFCFLLIGPEMLWIMGGEEYIVAAKVIPPVLVAYVCQFIYSLYVNIEFFYKKQKYIALGTIIAAAINIILNYLFIPVYGYVTAAYTTLIGYLVLLLVHYLFSRKMKKSGIYDTKFNFGFMLVFLGIMLLSNVLYRFTVIRYSVIVLVFILILFIVYILRRELICVLKTKSLQPIVERFVMREK